MKPYLWAERNLLLCEVYAHLDAFEAEFLEAKQQPEEPFAAKVPASEAIE